MTALLIGGTGAIGLHVAHRLWEREVDVTVLSRSRQNLAALPPMVRGVVSDIARATVLPAVFAGVDGVLLAPPWGVHGRELGLAVVAAAAAAGVQRLVLLSTVASDEPDARQDPSDHLAVEEATRTAPLIHTILRPRDLFQHDLRWRESVVDRQVYPRPLGGVGVSRIDARDVADAAVTSLLSNDHAGETYTLGGPDELDGAETAATYGRHLGRPVVYAGDDLDAWEELARDHHPVRLVDHLRSMYERFQSSGDPISDADLARQRPLVGHAPRTFEEFAAETCAGWRR